MFYFLSRISKSFKRDHSKAKFTRGLDVSYSITHDKTTERIWMKEIGYNVQ